MADSGETSSPANAQAHMRFENGRWLCPDPHNAEKTLCYDADKNQWMSYDAEKCAPNADAPINTGAAPDVDGNAASSTDCQCINAVWVHRDPQSGLVGLGQVRFYDDIAKEWRTPSSDQRNIEDAKSSDDDTEKKSAQPDDFQFQLRLQPNTFICAKSGTVYDWHGGSGQWAPRLDDDFIAAYQANYGVAHDEKTVMHSVSKLTRPPAYSSESSDEGECSDAEHSQADANARRPELSGAELAARRLAKEQSKLALASMTPQERKQHMKQLKKDKRADQAKRDRERGWFEIEEGHNKNVYVTGLPSTMTQEKLQELMSKYGVIDMDPVGRKLKLKLYTDEQGNAKGDARCCYIKKESVDLCLSLLDGAQVEGSTVHAELARFQQKGDYDPTKKKRKLNPKQLQKFREQQQKFFDWRPERSRTERPKSDCTVVLKHVFTLDELNAKPELVLELQESVRVDCALYGEVKRATLFHGNADGVVTVTFATPQMADDCITMMDYRQYAPSQVTAAINKRQVRAERWDGKAKFHSTGATNSAHADDEAQRIERFGKMIETE